MSINWHMALAEAGHDVSVIAGPASGDKQKIGNQSSSLSPPSSSLPVHLYRVDNRRFPLPPPVRRKGGGLWNMLERSWTVDRTIARLERTKGAFDVVEMPNWGAEGLFYSLHPRAPLVVRLSTPLAQVVQLRKNPSTRLGIRLVYFLEALPARRADCIIAHSGFIANYCAELYRIPISKSVLIPLGIPVAPSPPVKRTADDKEVTFLYVGRLERRKGIDHLLQAIPEVICSTPTCKFVIAGADTGDAPNGGSYQDYFDSIAPPAAREATTSWAMSKRGRSPNSMQIVISSQRRLCPSRLASFTWKQWFTPSRLSPSRQERRPRSLRITRPAFWLNWAT